MVRRYYWDHFWIVDSCHSLNIIDLDEILIAKLYSFSLFWPILAKNALNLA